MTDQPQTQPETETLSVDDIELPSVDALRGSTSRETAAAVADTINELPGVRARKRTVSMRLPGEAFTSAYVVVAVSMAKRSTVRSLADRLSNFTYDLTENESLPSSLNYELIEAESFPDTDEVVADDVSPRRIFREWLLMPGFSGYGGHSQVYQPQVRSSSPSR